MSIVNEYKSVEFENKAYAKHPEWTRIDKATGTDMAMGTALTKDGLTWSVMDGAANEIGYIDAVTGKATYTDHPGELEETFMQYAKEALRLK
jgi:hypothetical protein